MPGAIARAAPLPHDADEETAAFARSLHSATMTLIEISDDPARDSHVLFDHLSHVVRHQRTRRGILTCLAFAEALKAGDHAGALRACRWLTENALGHRPITQGFPE